MYVELVAPLIALPARFHWYEKTTSSGIPSGSDNPVVTAVNIDPSLVFPLIVTLPVGSSFTFAIALVEDLVTLSENPR